MGSAMAACAIKLRNEQLPEELSIETNLATRAEDLKKMVLQKLMETGTELGKKVTSTSMIRLFYMGKELGGKNGDGKLEEYKIKSAEANYVILHINLGISAPGSSEKSTNCPCCMM